MIDDSLGRRGRKAGVVPLVGRRDYHGRGSPSNPVSRASVYSWPTARHFPLSIPRDIMQQFSDINGNAWVIDFSVPGRLDFVAGIGRELRDHPDRFAERLLDGVKLADMVCLLATGPRQLRDQLRAELIDRPETRNAAAGALLDSIACFAPRDARLSDGVAVARRSLPAETLQAVPPARGMIRM